MMFISIVLAAALSSGNAEFDRVAVDGARKISVSRVRAELLEKGPRPGGLEAAMLADPAKYVDPKEARRLVRSVFYANAKSQFEEMVRAVDERLGRKAAEGSLCEEDVESVAERHFAKAFEAERRRAVERQAKTIVAATRPTEAEFDELGDDEVRRIMVDRIVAEQSTPVFLENREFISANMVDPVVADARREQKRQSEYLMRARSDALAPSRLAADLETRLRENVRERRAKATDPSKAWGVFEKTFGRSVGSAVERRLLSRLEKKVDSASVVVDEASIARKMDAEPAVHANAKKSEASFRQMYSARIFASAMEAACADASDAERAELGEYLAKRAADGRIAKAVDTKMEKDVLPVWRRARAAVAVKQAAETWPTLENRTWCPSPELADELVARSDYAKAVRNWRSAKGMEGLAEASAGKNLMEEAESRADRDVSAAFDIARSAIAAQNNIVDACHDTVLRESRRRKDSFWRMTPDLAAVRAMLTRETEQAWERQRLGTLWPDAAKRPSNAARQHRELFPSVKRKIELVARVILEEMREIEPKDAEPDPQTPPEEALLEFEISVSRSGDNVEVTLKKGGETVESESVRARKGDFDKAMRKVSKAISGLLELD